MNTFTTEELLAWAGIAAAITGAVGLYLGHRVGYKSGYGQGHYDGRESGISDECQWQNAVRAEEEKRREARLAAECAKRDLRGRYKKKAGAV